MLGRLTLISCGMRPPSASTVGASRCSSQPRGEAAARASLTCEPTYEVLGVGPSDTCRWTTLDVKTFLEGIRGENFLRAAETCFENCVDGKTLASLTQEQLESLLHLDAREALALSRELKVPTHVCAT